MTIQEKKCRVVVMPIHWYSYPLPDVKVASLTHYAYSRNFQRWETICGLYVLAGIAGPSRTGNVCEDCALLAKRRRCRIAIPGLIGGDGI